MAQKRKMYQCKQVNASAGSGKTFALACHYIFLLFFTYKKQGTIALYNILGITFTNKAMIEMKQRVIYFLKLLSSDDTKNDMREMLIGYIVPLGFQEYDICKISNKVLEILFRNYDDLHIKTIDSFMHTIIHSCSIYDNTTSQEVTEDEYDIYLNSSFERVIDSIADNKEARNVFRRYFVNYLYINPEPLWMPRQSIVANLKMFQNMKAMYGMKFKGSSTDLKITFLLRNEIVSILKKIREWLPEGAKKAVINACDVLVNESNTFYIERFNRFKVFKEDTFPVKKGYEIDEKLQLLWKELKVKVSQYCELLAAQMYDPFVEIYHIVDGTMKENLREEEMVLLNELSYEAKDVIENDEIEKNEIFYRLATRYYHYLIDEFQDTNSLQWKNLKSFIREALHQEGTFYYVGDKKQSIYRFRGADYYLFDGVPRQFPHYGFEKENLPVNRRSAASIVQCVNSVFENGNINEFLFKINENAKEADVCLSDEDMLVIRKVYEGAEQKVCGDKLAGYVDISYYEGKNSNECLEAIEGNLISYINDCISRGYQYHDIACLVRSNKELKIVSEILIKHDLPVLSDKTVSIAENSIIKALIAFLRFLDSPIDDIAFVATITSELFYAVSGLREEEVNAFLFSCRFKKENRPFYIVFRDTYVKEWEKYINPFFKKIGISPLYEFLREICETFEVFAYFPEHEACIIRLFEMIKEEETRHSSVSEFLFFFKELDEHHYRLHVHIPENQNAIMVSTIHKSKGLEYPIVVLPNFYLRINVPSRKIVVDEEDNCMRIVHLQKAFNEWSENLYKLYKDEYISELISELNSCYVAMTRAKYELYCMIPERVSGNKYNMLDLLFPNKNYNSGQKKIYEVNKENLQEDVIVLKTDPYIDWHRDLKDEFADVRMIKMKHLIDFGNMYHSVLGNIQILSENNYKEEISIAIDKVRLSYPLFKDWDAIKNTIVALVEKAELKRYFFDQEATVYCEKEICTKDGKLLRIDRLVCRNDEITILDYKSSADGEESGMLQMREYMQVVANMYPKKRIEGNLVYLDSKRMKNIEI